MTFAVRPIFGGADGIQAQCFPAGTNGVITAPVGATGVTVKMWGGGGGGGGGSGTAGYGGGGAAYLERSFSVVGGTTQIEYFSGAKGTGAASVGAGTAGAQSTILTPPGLSPVIVLTATGGNPGTNSAPGLPGSVIAVGGIPIPGGSAPTAGALPTGGDAANAAGGGGVGGAPGTAPGGGGNGDINFGWDGGEGSLCLYWTYPSNIVLSDTFALNTSLAGVGGTATATYRLDSDGQAYRTNAAGTLIPISGQWLTSGTASDYEVYAQWSPMGGGPGGIVGGGTIGGATPATWLSLSSQRNFTLTDTNNYAERELYIQIRRASTQEIVNFCTVNVSVDSAP
jgi:hypothetical protein